MSAMVLTKTTFTSSQVPTTMAHDFHFTRGEFQVFSAIVNSTAQANPKSSPKAA